MSTGGVRKSRWRVRRRKARPPERLRRRAPRSRSAATAGRRRRRRRAWARSPRWEAGTRPRDDRRRSALERSSKAPHGLRLVAGQLLPGEADDAESGRFEHRLLARVHAAPPAGAVELVAVDFDDERCAGDVEVDLEPGRE